MLLDKLVAASPDNTLYYSGDFDLKGLQIAAYLMARYPSRCHPWRFDPDSYTLALRSEPEIEAVAAHPQQSELDLLDTLPGSFAPLIEKMRERKVWAYQEGIARLLAEDILRCGA